jgi:(+)-pinoresinol hydroxylase
MRAFVCVILLWASVANAAESDGQQVFNRLCVHCHGPGVWGTNRLSQRFVKEQALLVNRKDLTVDGIRSVVRMGVGSMPPLRKTELSDADLSAVAAYLTRKGR